MTPHAPNMTIAEMREAMHTYAASSEASTATYKLAMDTIFGDQARQASDMLTAVSTTTANQHNYIAQREAEHELSIIQHQQRYALLEAELAAEKAHNLQRREDRSKTPTTARLDTSIDMFEANEHHTLPLHSIETFMQEDHIDTASPLPMFPALQADPATNN